MLAIVVLSDGETWSCTDGASICLIEDGDYESLCQGAKPRNIQPVFELSLTDVTPPLNIDKNQQTLFDEEH